MAKTNTVVEVKHEDKFTGTYFQWIKEELSGWDTFPWLLFGFGAGFELATLLLGKINSIAIITFIGTFFGMWCTVAMSAGGYDKNGNRVRSHSINGLMGSLSVIAYIIVNYSAGHWFSIIDQLFFFFLIDAPLLWTWRTWGRGKNSKMNSVLTFDEGSSIGHKIKQYFTSKWMLIIPIILVLWFALYHVGLLTNDSNPVWDALALSIGATASYLCFRRYTQTYTLWLISDFVSIALWFTALRDGYSTAALPMLVMTIFYLATAIYGKLVWKVDKPEKEVSTTDDEKSNAVEA